MATHPSQTYELEPDDPADTAARPLPRICPGCGRAMPGGSVICVGCGYDHRKGLTAAPREAGRAQLPCRKCGYELVGLKTAVCPECGTYNRAKDRRTQDRDTAAQISRVEYIKPLIIAGVCFALGLLWQWRSGGLPAAMREAVIIAAQVPAAVAAFRLCELFWLGFDAPLRLVALRLLACVAAFNLFWGPASVLGRSTFGRGVDWLVPLAIFAGLMWDLFDIDAEDVGPVAALTVVPMVGIAFALYRVL